MAIPNKNYTEKDFPLILLQLKRIADALEKNNVLNEKRLKIEHVSFIKEQRATKAGTDYKSYKEKNSGEPSKVKD